MEEQYRKEITWWFAELGLESEVDNYLALFPELKSRLSKFAIGILKWNLAGLIDINNPDDVSRVRLILKVLDQTPGFDFFDNTFNEATPETVCKIIGMAPITPIEEPEIEFEYTVSYIGSYAEARQYLDMTSWCIVISEESFNAYTVNGNVPCIPGNGFPMTASVILSSPLNSVLKTKSFQSLRNGIPVLETLATSSPRMT